MPGATKLITFSEIPTAGSFKLRVAGTGDSGAIAFGAVAADLDTALDTLMSPEGVTVTGTYVVGFTATWASTSPVVFAVSNTLVHAVAADATVERLTPGGGVDGTREQQTIIIIAEGGTWTLEGRTLAFNASTAAVEAALESALSRGVSVTGSPGMLYQVTWDDAGDRALLSVNGTNLTGGAASASAFVNQDGSGGTSAPEVQRITLPTANRGSWDVAGETVDAGATANTVAAAISAGLGVGVTATGPDGGPYTVTWDAAGAQDLLVVDTTDLTRAVAVMIDVTVAPGAVRTVALKLYRFTPEAVGAGLAHDTRFNMIPAPGITFTVQGGTAAYPGGVALTAVTDVTGTCTFRLTESPASPYVVSFNNPSGRSERCNLTVTPTGHSPSVFYAEREAAYPLVYLERIYNFTVIDSANLPVAGAVVQVTVPGGAAVVNPVERGTTDANGQVALTLPIRDLGAQLEITATYRIPDSHTISAFVTSPTRTRDVTIRFDARQTADAVALDADAFRPASGHIAAGDVDMALDWLDGWG